MKAKVIRVTSMIVVTLILIQACSSGSSNENLMNDNESVNSIENIEIGGITQWIHLKGNDINKPVL